MLLKSTEAARLHREAKRQIEIERILCELQSLTKNRWDKNRDLNILEFGCGSGFQIPYLSKLGNVYGIDIYTSKEIRSLDEVKFCESSVTDIPFKDHSFDLLFSNHVIEHLPDPERVFDELRRVGKQDAIFVFSVPTNYWLLLSIPSKYFGKIIELRKILSNKFSRNATEKPQSDMEKRLLMEEELAKGPIEKQSFFSLLLPKGHGVHNTFLKCYQSFKIREWQRFFTSHNFELLDTTPLLLYGPSERPIIPTTSKFLKYGICSSVLFVLK